MHKELSPLFNSSGVNTDRTSHSWRFGCRLLAKTPTRAEEKKERRTANGRETDEQVPVFLVSTDTGIGTCDHNFVTLACSDLQWHCAAQPCTRTRTHTDTKWLVNQSEYRAWTIWKPGRVLLVSYRGTGEQEPRWGVCVLVQEDIYIELSSLFFD